MVSCGPLGARRSATCQFRLLTCPSLLEPPENEQEQAEAVQVAARLGVREVSTPDQSDTAPLGAPHYRPGQVQSARRRSRAGQDEAGGHLDLCLQVHEDAIELSYVGHR